MPLIRASVIADFATDIEFNEHLPSYLKKTEEFQKSRRKKIDKLTTNLAQNSSVFG